MKLTLFGEELTNIFLEVDAEHTNPHYAIERVVFVDRKEELSPLGLQLFIKENWDVLNALCTKAAEQYAEAQAQGATLQ